MHSKNLLVINAILALVLAVSVSCRGTGVMKVAEFSEHVQALPRTITLVNWNTHKGGNPQFVPDLARLLEQEQPDLE